MKNEETARHGESWGHLWGPPPLCLLHPRHQQLSGTAGSSPKKPCALVRSRSAAAGNRSKATAEGAGQFLGVGVPKICAAGGSPAGGTPQSPAEGQGCPSSCVSPQRGSIPSPGPSPGGCEGAASSLGAGSRWLPGAEPVLQQHQLLGQASRRRGKAPTLQGEVVSGRG